jgi:plasmid stability protein
MAQLIVRNLEDRIIKKLRQKAVEAGVSTEEEHRRILQRVLLGSQLDRKSTLKEYLCTMPGGMDERDFERPKSKLRRVNL